MTYTATVVHHSIGQHYSIKVGNDLDEAKRKADEEFGDGFLDHTIVISDASGETVAQRRIGDEGWGDDD